MTRHHAISSTHRNHHTDIRLSGLGVAAVVTAIALLASGCIFFQDDPCEDLQGDSRQEADACFGTWVGGPVYEEPSGVYSLQYIDHDHHDPTSGWFDTCQDEAWTREFVIIEHVSGRPGRPDPADRVVYHERRRCAWNVRCFASDTLLRNDVTLASGQNPVAGLELNCDR